MQKVQHSTCTSKLKTWHKEVMMTFYSCHVKVVIYGFKGYIICDSWHTLCFTLPLGNNGCYRTNLPHWDIILLCLVNAQACQIKNHSCFFVVLGLWYCGNRNSCFDWQTICACMWTRENYHELWGQKQYMFPRNTTSKHALSL